MTETNKTLAEVITDLAQQTINRVEPFGVIDVPLQIQISSDHSEIHLTKGDLHLMVAMTGEDTGIFDCNNWFGDCIQNPFWLGNLKVADVIWLLLRFVYASCGQCCSSLPRCQQARLPP